MTTKVATLIPAKARRIIYTVLGLAAALEVIWDIVPSALEGRILATLTALGFGLATSQTRDTAP